MWALIIFLATLAAADHFALIAPSAPALQTTDANARPAGRRDAAIWIQNQDLYVFGGQTEAGRTRDFWKYEPATRRWLWFPSGPGVVGRSGALYWNMANQFWLYGGVTDDAIVLDDLWSFTLSDRTWHAKTLATGPRKVYDMPCWTSSATNKLFLYDNAVIWSYQIMDNEWTPHNLTLAPDIGVGSSFAQVGNQLYVVCGGGLFWRLSIDSMQWTSLNMIGGPSARSNGHLFPTRSNDAILFFGGIQGAQEYADFWRYSIDKDTWSQQMDAVRPSPRCGGAVVSDNQENFYLLGGGSVPINDIWSYGPESTLQDLFNSIQFNLDSATLSALWAAAMSTIVLIIIAVVALASCVSKCRKRRRKLRMPMVSQAGNENADF